MRTYLRKMLRAAAYLKMIIYNQLFRSFGRAVRSNNLLINTHCIKITLRTQNIQILIFSL